MRSIPTPAEDAGRQGSGSSAKSQTSPPRRAKKMKSAMSNVSGLARSHERWARFRFSVIGPLLAAPPERGELQEQLKSLARQARGCRVAVHLTDLTKFRSEGKNQTQI